MILRRSVWALVVVLLLPGCGQWSSTSGSDTVAPPTGEEVAPARDDRGGGSAGESSEPERQERRRLPLLGRGRPPAPPPLGEPAHAPSLPRLPQRPDRIAVIVGIDDYPGEDSDLTAAVADARLMRRAFARLGFAEVRPLIGSTASRDAILSAVRWLSRNSGSGTTGVFFFAGHVRQIGGDPDGDGERVDEAMVAADGRLILDGELASALAPAAGPLWLAYASCYAEGFSDAAAPGRVSSYASDEGSLAYESRSLGHSFMAEFLVRRALLGEGLTSVEGMHRYARENMRGSERRFRPLLDDRLNGPLELGVAEEPGQPQPERSPGSRTCLVVLRCRE